MVVVRRRFVSEMWKQVACHAFPICGRQRTFTLAAEVDSAGDVRGASGYRMSI